MNREDEKKLLVIACTFDRLEAEVRWKKKLHRGGSDFGEWVSRANMAAKFLGPLAPRWMRIGSSLLTAFFKR